MTDKVTTAEIRFAATTNLDLPLTQYKKLENGFDAWLAEHDAAVAAKAVADFKKIIMEAQTAASKPVQAPVNEISAPAQTPSGNAPIKPIKRKRVRPKKNKSFTVEQSNS